MWSIRRSSNIITYMVLCSTLCAVIFVLVDICSTTRQHTKRISWLYKLNTDESTDSRTISHLQQHQQQSQLLKRTLDTSPSVGEVTHLRLVNATSNNTVQPLIDPLVNGAIINLYDYPVNQQFSVEALVNKTHGPIGSIRFIRFDGKRVNDNYERYVLCGDIKGSILNCSALSQVGNYTITATPHSLSNASGVAGTSHTIFFSVVNIIPPVKVNNTPPAAPGWVIVDPAAPILKRHESCFVLVGRKAYLVAGRARRNVEIYNIPNRSWSLGAKPPIQLHHAQCVVADEKIWIVSSWTGGYPMETNTNAIHVRTTAMFHPLLARYKTELIHKLTSLLFLSIDI